VRTTWHPLQSKACNAECAPKLETDGLNCIGVPQNGHRGCGASVSMHWLIAPEWLMKGKFDLQRRPFQNLECAAACRPSLIFGVVLFFRLDLHDQSARPQLRRGAVDAAVILDNGDDGGFAAVLIALVVGFEA
jgi:hypothetical protein